MSLKDLWARYRAQLVAALLAALASAGVVVAIEDTDHDGRPDRFTATMTVAAAPPAVAVDGPDADTKRDDALPLDNGAQDVLEDAAGLPESHPSELAEPLREPGDTGPSGVLDGPLAAQSFPGCRTAFVRNYSSRNGTRPQVIVWHYTVSDERPGWSDNEGLTAYANSAASGVSWNFLIGRKDGNCSYNVPLTMKAWTQGNANPFSIGIEVIARGNERSYVEGKGSTRLINVTREIGRRFGIPMRRAIVQNCRVIRSGVLRHIDLGACGGGHHDTTPFNTEPLFTALAKPAVNNPRAGSSYRLSALGQRERANASCLLTQRRGAHRAGGWTEVPKRQRRANYCKAGLQHSLAWYRGRDTGTSERRREVLRKVIAGRP